MGIVVGKVTLYRVVIYNSNFLTGYCMSKIHISFDYSLLNESTPAQLLDAG